MYIRILLTGKTDTAMFVCLTDSLIRVSDEIRMSKFMSS